MTAAPAVEVKDLVKVYQVRERPKGFGAGLRHAFVPRTRSVTAVDGLTFRLAPGERVAFVGPNGAGKSTTIKMLSGILAPTRGEVKVLGLTPTKDRRTLGYQIGTVFGQRSQLWYHLPAEASFDLLSRVYDLKREDYRARKDDLVDRFQIGALLAKPVRQLSLGERMRCEIVASLLHKPAILFLDEPTIGLDVTAKAVIRDLVRERSVEDGMTVLLTSHDTGDVERVTDRIVVINDGRLILDQKVAALRGSFIKQKIVTLKTVEPEIELALPGVKVLEKEPHLLKVRVDSAESKIESVISAVLKKTGLNDMTIEDPPMEDIVRKIYELNRVEAPGR